MNIALQNYYTFIIFLGLVKKVFTILFWVALFCSVFFLGIRQLSHLDTWIFLKSGQWIYEYKDIPTHDFLSFTHAGNSWTHVKWGYSLLVYSCYVLFSAPEMITLLQALLLFGIIGSLFMSWKILEKGDIALFSLIQNYNPLLICVVMLITLMGYEYRLLNRPEIISHLFSVLFLTVLLKSRTNWRVLLYLPLLQLIWSNMHDAFVIGWVLIALYLFSEFIRLKQKTLNKSSLIVFIILVSCILISMVNPLGIRAILYPFNLANQLEVNQYTPELFSFTSKEYWTHKEPYIMMVLFLVHFLVWMRGSKKDWFSLLIICSFFILGLRTYRNIAFFILLQCPLLLSYVPVLDKEKKGVPLNLILSTLILFVFSFSIITNKYYKALGSSERFGFNVSPLTTPFGISQYMDKNTIEEPVFTDYLTSAYLLWEHHPSFKSYIDLRDLDVYSAQDFAHYYNVINNVSLFEKELQKWNIHSIILYTGDYFNLHQYLYQSNYWHLKYLDFHTALYTTGDSSLQLNDSITMPQSIQRGTIAVHSSYKEKDVNTYYNIAKYFQGVGNYTEALGYSRKGAQQTPNHYENTLLFAKLVILFYQNDVKKGFALLKESEAALLLCVSKNKDKPHTFKLLGAVQGYLGKKQEGRINLLKAKEFSPDDTEIDQLLQLTNEL